MQWLEPKEPFESCLPVDMREYNELPQLQVDGEGRMWLAFRHRTCRVPREDGWAVQGRWDGLQSFVFTIRKRRLAIG